MKAVNRRWLAAGASVGLILVTTLLPSDGPNQPFRFCIICGEQGTADAIANIILFVPFGLAVGAVLRRPYRAIFAAIIFSTCIEFTQTSFVAGRDGDLGDILFNTAGAALSGWFLKTSAAWLYPSPTAERRLGGISTAAAALVVILTGYFTQLSLPQTAWFGQWTPQFGQMGYYDGFVIDVRSGGRLIPSKRLDDDGALRSDILADVPLVIRATSSRPTRRLAVIFSVFDQHQRRMLLLGADGDDLGLYVGRRATDARLVEPLLRVPGALEPLRAGDTVTFRVQRTAGGFCIGREPAVRCGLGLTAGSGWQLLLDGDSIRRYVGWMNCVWLFALLIPSGFWLNRVWLILSTIVLICGLVPGVAGLAASPVTEWIAGAGGAGVGMLLRRWIRGPRSTSHKRWQPSTTH